MRTILRQRGVAALMTALFVLFAATLVTFFSARVITTDLRIFKNVYDRTVAEDAAQAGFDYALGYLNENMASVLTSLSSCASAANTFALSPGTLTNNATYAPTYGCVTAGSTTVLTITSVGTTQDGAATRTVSTTVKIVGGQFSNYPVIGRVDVSNSVPSVDLQNSAQVSNPTANATTTVAGGNTVSLRTSSAKTTTSTGAPYICSGSTSMPPAASTNCKDISFSNSTLNAMSASQFETNFLGRALTDFQSIGTGSIPVYDVNCSGASGSPTAKLTFLSNTTFASVASTGCTCTLRPALTNCASTILSSITGSIIYFTMAQKRLELTTSAAFPTFNLGTSGSPVILVINSSNTGVAVNIGSNGGTQHMNINGNVYAAIGSGGEADFSGSGTNIMNGLIYVNGHGRVISGFVVNGVLVAGQAEISNTSVVTYTPTNIQSTLGGYYGAMLTPGTGGSGASYAVVPGSWRDF